MEEQELVSYPNHSHQLTARYYTALYIDVLCNSIEMQSLQALPTKSGLLNAFLVWHTRRCI